MYSQTPIAIAGAGFSGAVIAQQLAQANYKVDVFETRNHVAGNCHTERDQATGVMVHRYGPHIFHTDNERVWQFINRYTEMMPYINRVKAQARNAIYSLPINLLTLNQFFGACYSPNEARKKLQEIADSSIHEPKNFEEQALKMMGSALYGTFFKGYTLKQWGRHPTSLPASILKRLPMRFNYDDNYFSHRYQGMPRHGYTAIVEKLLDHPNIRLHLGEALNQDVMKQYQHCFYSGPIDRYFNYSLGRLAYRTLDFQMERHEGDYQGCAVLNYCDENIPYTRISEHKHFAPWETHERSVIFKEFSREAEDGDTPFYPVGLVENNALIEAYRALAAKETHTTFVGRLGTYRYLDMDVTIQEALETADQFLKAHR